MYRRLTKGHVDNSASLTTLAKNVVDSPLETVKDNRSRRLAITENLDIDNVGRLRNTESPSSNSSRNMGAVAEGIVEGTTSGVVSVNCTTAKLDMPNIDATIYDVGIATAAGARVEEVGCRSAVPVGDGAEAPGGAGLGHGSREGIGLVQFDLSNLYVFLLVSEVSAAWNILCDGLRRGSS